MRKEKEIFFFHSLFPDIKESSSRFLRAMFDSRGTDDEVPAATKQPSLNSLKSGGSTLRQNAGKRKQTVTERFMRQLSSLSDQLEKTHRHYIRCIRPNQSSKPNLFEGTKQDKKKFSFVIPLFPKDLMHWSKCFLLV